jgi:hypothetical protein
MQISVFSTTHINNMHKKLMHMGLLMVWLWHTKILRVQQMDAVHVSDRNKGMLCSMMSEAKRLYTKTVHTVIVAN